MINKVILVGNLGRDPEVRKTTSGQTVANISLATNRRWRSEDGERKEATEWHRIVVFGRPAENAGKYLCRGELVYVEGRLQTRSWDKDGERRYSTEVVCESFQMLGGRSDRRGESSPEPEGDDA